MKTRAMRAARKYNQLSETITSDLQQRWARYPGYPLSLILQWDENLDVGSDTGSPVNDADYQIPFAFTGKLDKITLTIDRPQLSPEDIEKLEMAQRNNRASE
jgi:hypothetical protein